jgi:hypothetical protein
MKKVTGLFFSKLCLIGATLFFSIISNAQVEQTARYERDHKYSDPELTILPMYENGMALIHDKEKYNDGKKLWQLIVLDTDLKETMSLELATEPRLRLVGYDYKDDLIYLLFRSSEHEGSDLNLVTIDSKTQEIKRFTIKQELTFKVTHFSVLSRAVILGGYVNKDPAILIYDLQTENLKIVPGFFVSETELLDLRVNANNTFNTLIIDRNTKEKKRLMLKTFDATGAMLFEDIIEIDIKRSILSGITSTLINDELLITGTWTTGTSKQASGIYSVMADPFSDQIIKFYDFGSLQNFLEYQSEKRAARLKEKSSDARASGSIPDFKTYTSVIRMEEQPGKFALLAEVYQPSANFTPTPYWPSSNPYYYGGGYSPYGYNPFMNRYYNRPYQYQYNNGQTQVGEAKIEYSSLLIFDEKGNLTNDYGFVLDEKKSNGLEQTSDFIFSNNNIAIAYKKEKEILVKHYTPDGSKLDTLQTTLEKPDEFVRSDSENGFIRFWYQNFMYSWGYQRIKDQGKKSEDPNRYVFYINKIRID